MLRKTDIECSAVFLVGGGSSMGYKLAGYEVMGNCEIDPQMNKLYLKNIKPKYNFLMGVQDFKLLDDIPEELYDIDVLDGSPPCSTFSMAGEREKNWGKEKKFREGQAKQILSDLFFEYIDVCEKLHPKVVVAENVKGIICGNAKSYMNAIIKKFDSIGYEMQAFLLNSATMGVPQRRERVFFVGRRKDLHLPKLELNFNEKPILYGEFADEDYTPLTPGTETYRRWHLRRDKDRCLGDTISRTEKGKLSGFTTAYLKPNEVPATLTANGTVFLRFDVCGLASKKDMITIQTFPQDYDFMNSSIQYVCGMSVPPLMMRALSKEIQIQILDKMKHDAEKMESQN